MDRLMTYFNERFPLAPVLMVAGGFGVYATLVYSTFSLTTFLFFTLAFMALLLRQRVTDEFKDSDHDTKNYPKRPYQRGVITKGELITLGIFALIVELWSVYMLSPAMLLLLYLPVLVFSMLMAVEFFVGKWLNERFTLYFILHECIFILIGIWILLSAHLSVTYETFSWLVAFIAVMISFEIARKYEVRKDTNGKNVADTYLTVWGKSRCHAILAGLMITAGIGLTVFLSSYLILIPSIVCASLLAFHTWSPKHVKVITAIHFLSLGIGAHFI